MKRGGGGWAGRGIERNREEKERSKRTDAIVMVKKSIKINDLPLGKNIQRIEHEKKIWPFLAGI